MAAIRPAHVIAVALLQVCVAAGRMAVIGGLLFVAGVVGAPTWFINTGLVIAGLVFLVIVVSAGIAIFNAVRGVR